MVSTQRLLQYSQLEPELEDASDKLSDEDLKDWPSQGEIVLEDAYFRHSTQTPFVLKGLHCYIRPSEKVCKMARHVMYSLTPPH